MCDGHTVVFTHNAGTQNATSEHLRDDIEHGALHDCYCVVFVDKIECYKNRNSSYVWLIYWHFDNEYFSPSD
jgi:hypothetical protein